MPTYCYSDDSGHYEEKVFPMGKAPHCVQVDEFTLVRDFAAEQGAVRTIASWPLECLASGVPPSQSGELREFFKKHGENVEVRNGHPVYTSPNQRKRLLKLRGLHDNDSYS